LNITTKSFISRKKRIRDAGAGRPFKLKVKERFVMLLVYYRLYMTYTLSGFLFDLDQSNVCRDLTILELLVKECVPFPDKIYKHTRTRKLRTIDEVEQYFPGFKAFIDSTEHHYSGKKKKHTVQTQFR
jgi:hypothetical protein